MIGVAYEGLSYIWELEHTHAKKQESLGEKLGGNRKIWEET